MSIVLSAGLLDSIRRHGCADYPQECCGLLLGHAHGENRRVTELRRMGNSLDESRHRRYLISPDDMLGADKEARVRGLDILGVYHSHPDHPARPSEFDRDHALPWYSYIILNVNHGEPGDLASWRLREDRSSFEQEELIWE